MLLRLFYTCTSILFLFSASAQIQRAEVQAAGLTCALCSKAIYESLQTLAFVEEVQPDLNRSSFDLRFRKGMPIDPDALRIKIEDAGFSVALLKLMVPADSIDLSSGIALELQGIRMSQMNRSAVKKDSIVSILFIDKGFLTEKKYKEYRKFIVRDAMNKEQDQDQKFIYHVWVE